MNTSSTTYGDVPAAPAPRPLKKLALAPPESDSPQDILFRAHNWIRVNNAIPPFASEAKLDAAAQGHADHMARFGRFGHSGVGDGDLGSRLAAAGYEAGFAGENIAYGYETPGDVMLAWWESPGHHRNMLAPYAQAGFGVAWSPSGVPYWVAVFGSPLR